MKDLDARNKANNTAKKVGINNVSNTDTKYLIKALSEIPYTTRVVTNNANQQVVTYQPQGYGYTTNTNTNTNSNNNTNDPNKNTMGTNIGFSTDPNGNVQFNMNVNGTGNGTNVGVNSNGMNTQSNSSYSSTTTTTNGVTTYQIANSGHSACASPMSAALFNIEKTRFVLKN